MLASRKMLLFSQFIHIHGAADSVFISFFFWEFVFHAHLYIGHLWHTRIAVVVATNCGLFPQQTYNFRRLFTQFGNRVFVLLQVLMLLQVVS